jgi:hypothetical protein
MIRARNRAFGTKPWSALGGRRDKAALSYFGSIPHAELMRSLARRIADRRLLQLIKMWLECSVAFDHRRDPDS